MEQAVLRQANESQLERLPVLLSPAHRLITGLIQVQGCYADLGRIFSQSQTAQCQGMRQ